MQVFSHRSALRWAFRCYLPRHFWLFFGWMIPPLPPSHTHDAPVVQQAPLPSLSPPIDLDDAVQVLLESDDERHLSISTDIAPFWCVHSRSLSSSFHLYLCFVLCYSWCRWAETLFVTLVTEVSLISREPNLRFERIYVPVLFPSAGAQMASHMAEFGVIDLDFRQN